MLVHHAHQHLAIRLAVDALAANAGGGVVEPREDLSLDVLRMRCDDDKLICRLVSAQNIVSDEVGNKAIRHAQAHRLVVKGEGAVFGAVDKERGKGNPRIDDKVDPEEIEVRALLADALGNDVGAAGGGVLAEAGAVHKPAEHARDQAGENGVVVARIINDGIQGIYVLKDQIGHRVDHTEHHGFDTELAIHIKERKGAKRHVHDQRKITDAEPAFVLDHGGNAVETRRGKVVGCDKQYVGKTQQHRANTDPGIVRDLGSHRMVFL